MTATAPTTDLAPATGRSRNARTGPRRFLLPAAGVLVAVVFLAPYAVMLLDSLRPAGEVLASPPTFLPEHWRFGAYSQILGATGYTFNQVTVPAAPCPRMLLITGQLYAVTSGTDERWDHVVRKQDGTALSLACFHGGPSRITTSVAQGHYLLPAATPLVLTQFVARGGGMTTGTAGVGSSAAHYTGLRVIAFPVL